MASQALALRCRIVLACAEFVWHKTAEQILERIAGYCAAVNEATGS